ncbi:hypothetical protein FB451DRAFT_1058179, partial [Mycena latifolia]
LQITNGELAAQLAGTHKPGQLDATKGRSLSTRAADAERRLNNALNQLLFTEKATMNQKSAAADAKWEVRVCEYEECLTAAEERVPGRQLV